MHELLVFAAEPSGSWRSRSKPGPGPPMANGALKGSISATRLSGSALGDALTQCRPTQGRWGLYTTSRDTTLNSVVFVSSH
jgi:hypothetical protein